MRNLVWVLALAACGGGSDRGTIKIDRFGEVAHPTQLAVRDGDAAWKVIPIDSTELVVESDRYLLAAACEFEYDTVTFTYSSMYGRAVDDGDRVGLPCASYDFVNETRHVVTIQMQEPGSVRLGDNETAQGSGPWTAMLDVAEGSHVLTAFDETRLAIRRAVAITGPTTLDPVSLAVEGKPLVEKSFTLVGANGPLFGYSFLYVGDELAWYSQGADGNVRIADPSLLTAADQHSIYLGDGDSYVYLDDYQESLPTSYTLLPALTGVTRAGRGVSWSSVPDVDAFALHLNSPDGLTSENVFVSATWLGATTELALEFDAIPNWNPAWMVSAGELVFEVQTHPNDDTTIGSTIRLQ